MNRQKMYPNKSAQQGVVILEALIAILLFSMGVLAIVGLQAAMIKNTDDAKYRAEAGNIAQKCIGEIWAFPGAVACPNTAAQVFLPNGNLDVVANGTEYMVTITWLLPGEPSGTTPHNFTTIASVAGNV